MSGAKMARHPVVQRGIGGAQTAAQKALPPPDFWVLLLNHFFVLRRTSCLLLRSFQNEYL